MFILVTCNCFIWSCTIFTSLNVSLHSTTKWYNKREE